MTDPARMMTEYRALRDAAWAVVRADLAGLEMHLERRGIGERIKDRAAEEAHEAWDQARDVASEHKGVVAATVLALVAWLLRGPISVAISGLLDRDGHDGEEQAGRESVDAEEGDNP